MQVKPMERNKIITDQGHQRLGIWNKIILSQGYFINFEKLGTVSSQ